MPFHTLYTLAFFDGCCPSSQSSPSNPSAAEWRTNCVTFCKWSSSDLNQTGSWSILSQPSPEHTVHQSMTRQYSIRIAQFVLLWEIQSIFLSDCERFDEAFTAETFCLFSWYKQDVWNFTLTVWSFVILCKIFTKTELWLLLLIRIKTILPFDHVELRSVSTSVSC